MLKPSILSCSLGIRPSFSLIISHLDWVTIYDSFMLSTLARHWSRIRFKSSWDWIKNFSSIWIPLRKPSINVFSYYSRCLLDIPPCNFALSDYNTANKQHNIKVKCIILAGLFWGHSTNSSIILFISSASGLFTSVSFECSLIF